MPILMLTRLHLLISFVMSVLHGASPCPAVGRARTSRKFRAPGVLNHAKSRSKHHAIDVRHGLMHVVDDCASASEDVADQLGEPLHAR